MVRAEPNPDFSDVPVALLAGGLATRLGGVARQVPKALVPVAGKPFIDHQLELLHRHGIRRVVLCVGHLGEQIEAHLGNGSAHDMELSYSHDGPVLVGTGGAIARAQRMLGEVFWVMYGDSYMEIDYRSIYDRFARAPQTPRPLGLMTVIRNENRWDSSNAIFERGRLTRYDKRRRTGDMQYIDYGVQILRREALREWSNQERWDLSDLYHDLVARDRMLGYEVFNRFYEIGTPQSLKETADFLAAGAGHEERPATDAGRPMYCDARKENANRWE